MEIQIGEGPFKWNEFQSVCLCVCFHIFVAIFIINKNDNNNNLTRRLTWHGAHVVHIEMASQWIALTHIEIEQESIYEKKRETNMLMDSICINIFSLLILQWISEEKHREKQQMEREKKP